MQTGGEQLEWFVRRNLAVLTPAGLIHLSLTTSVHASTPCSMRVTVSLCCCGDFRPGCFPYSVPGREVRPDLHRLHPGYVEHSTGRLVVAAPDWTYPGFVLADQDDGIFVVRRQAVQVHYSSVEGMQLYRQERPFFLGLILGYFSGIAAANTSDFIWFNGQGHWLDGLY